MRELSDVLFRQVVRQNRGQGRSIVVETAGGSVVVTPGVPLDGSVTTAKLADSAVTPEKLAPGAAVLSLNSLTGALSVAVDGDLLTLVVAGTTLTIGLAALTAATLTTRWEPLGNGDQADPELLFTPDGDVLVVEVSN